MSLSCRLVEIYLPFPGAGELDIELQDLEKL
jgi:hypothetical protein